jgi:putative ABC transport system ATP-binding protein
MITLNNVTKSYKDPISGSDNLILNVPNLSFERSFSYGLFGPSGSGKTTLLHLISGLILPSAGSIKVAGNEITSLSESARDKFRANHIGYVFQSFNLLDGYTALENVMLGMVFSGKKSDVKKAEIMLERVGLKDRMHFKPGQLSMGQQQRVCIARALINDPEVLLADEPTGNLDPKTTEEVLELIFEQTANQTLLLVTHETHVLNAFKNQVDLKPFTPHYQEL